MRSAIRVFVVVLILLGVLPGSASAMPHRPLVLHPKWHRISGSNNVEVQTTGRYVYIGGTSSGLLIDEQTGEHLNLTPPSGYYVGLPGNGLPIGGSWVIATCNSFVVCASSPTYQLFNIPAGTWTPLLGPNLNMAGGYGWVPAAIGDSWLEWTGNCGYHCGPTTWAFQNLQSGEVDGPPLDWQPGGNQIPDLNSPTLTQTLCPPLTVPTGSRDLYTGQIYPGTINFYGQFAIAELSQGPYLERCGSPLHKPIIPVPVGTIAANAHAMIWALGYRCARRICYPRSTLDGLFLPTLRQFRLTMPATASLVAMSAKHIYAATNGVPGSLYVAPAPSR